MRTSGPAILLTAAALMAAPQASSAPLGCGALSGAVVDGVCQVIESAPGYTLDLRFPLDYPDEQAVVDYLAQTKAGFVNVAKTPESDGALGRPYELDVTAESFQSAQTRSVVLTLFQNVGGAHPTTWYKSFTYDTGRGRPVTFDTLFAAETKALDVIFPIVRDNLEADTGLAGSISPGDGRDPGHYQNFAITDDAVVFFFGRGELLPSYAGATSVSVPRSAIPPLQI